MPLNDGCAARRCVPLVGSLQTHSGLGMHQPDSQSESPSVAPRLHPSEKILVGQVPEILAEAADPVLSDPATNPEGPDPRSSSS